jgi:hypothetical protein
MKTALFTLVFLFAAHAHAAVWTATSNWSAGSEQRYQDWVRTTWTKNIFNEPGPLQNIKLDCADAVYTMRLLFAYENKLPFAVKDPSSNRVISNDMSRFNKISNPDQRFRAFALYLYDILGTATLAEDSYALATNRSAIHAGVFLKTDHATHHSWTVRDLDRAGVPYLIFASRPAHTTLLERHYFPTMGFLWGQQDEKGRQVDSALQSPGDPASGVGFRMYRYPSDLLKPEWQVPGYSSEQFQMNRISWARVLQRALQVSAETPEELSERLLGEACKEATDRIASVQDALKAMSQHASSYCFNAREYDDLSTPSRDARSVGVFAELVSAYRRNAAYLSPSTRARVGAVVENRDGGSYCPLRIGGGLSVTLGQAVSLALANRWSSNPNDSLRARWGLERWPTSHAASCPTY